MIERIGAAGALFTDDPFVTHVAAYVEAEPPSYRLGDALALTCHLFDGPAMIVAGPDPDVVRLLRALLPELPATQGWLSVPERVVPEVAGIAGFRAGEPWAFRWTAVPPDLPLPDGLGWLPPEADAEVEALLQAGFPDASQHPGDRGVRRWAGLRDATGRLVACAADTTAAPTVGFLASITSHPDVRGTGAGAAVSAWATAAMVREHGRAGLWHYGHNAVAAGLYTRLGYRDDHRQQGLLRDMA